MQDQPSRLDRIEAALESFTQRMEARFEQAEARFEQQMQLNAALRTDLEVQKNTAETLLRIVEVHQQNIEILAEAIRQHRADGHGA
jgi:hypothetical protein